MKKKTNKNDLLIYCCIPILCATRMLYSNRKKIYFTKITYK